MIGGSKTVHLIPTGCSGEFAQSLYIDRATWTLVPNVVCIDDAGGVLFETNSLGLRGAEPKAGERFAVVWGDSFVFSLFGAGWPEQINDESIDCLFLNGGVEARLYPHTILSAINFNRRHTVALNLLTLGWMPPDNRRVYGDLLNTLAELPNPVLLTQPTSLNPIIAGRDLTAYIGINRFNDDEHFGFFASEPYSVQHQAAFFQHISERNALIRAAAAATQTPLIDLYALFDTSSIDDFRRDFRDISHLRTNAYPRIASFVRESVRSLLPVRKAEPVTPRPS